MPLRLGSRPFFPPYSYGQPAMVDIQPILVGPDFRIRPLVAADRDNLYIAARDPLIWEQHPARNRHQRNVFDGYFSALVAAGGALAFEERPGGRIVGCSRHYEAPNAPGEWSVGFTFIERRLWGGAANMALKTLMLDHLFITQPRVWFHIGKDNIRSQKGTGKLGAVADGRCHADLLGAGNAEAFLTFRLDAAAWASVSGR